MDVLCCTKIIRIRGIYAITKVTRTMRHVGLFLHLAVINLPVFKLGEQLDDWQKQLAGKDHCVVKF